MAKFTRVGIACNIVKLKEDGTDSFTFTPKSFVFNTVSFDSAKKHLFSMKFFGLTEGDNLGLLYRFILEEKYRH